MCYNAAYSIEKNLLHAIERETNPKWKEQLREAYEKWKQNPNTDPPRIEPPVYYSNAFAHDKFPVIYLNEDAELDLGFFRWGLIPRWCREESKGLKLWNSTINARSETIFDKPSYRASALDRRCIVVLDGFFEYHHQGSKKFPFFIKPAKNEPMYVAGLWDKATLDGQVFHTFTIVTTSGNGMMKSIHNNPKNPNRSPVMLRQDQFEAWLQPTEKEDDLAKQFLKEDIMIAAPNDYLSAWPVAQLQGKNGVGNKPDAQVKQVYDDLALDIEQLH